ncbi:RrF2 family transcriptional regulator [Serratia rhizosphaerae]|uniref:Rrf2 family transcriptional regulator n=1 Tax=Serratia rhizosphaerae TaxID=2597702 RepID=A0ABX6GT02_9GAMM|nr:Rrf2 family transcriptional regulator [Serratia rhizosphaerae]QHA89423.1 Rrf2 family transcriptional regulator [Serratia rhizosphaerae]
MAYITVSVEYGIHCLLWLVDNPQRALSSRELAELQGISPSFLAKIFPRLEKAGIVTSSEGVRGGYRLARPADEITFLDMIDAIEGHKPLFECQEVRQRCAIFDNPPPDWAVSDRCAVHGVILQAEKAMRNALAKQTLGSVAARFGRTAPADFFSEVNIWMDERITERTSRSGKAPRNKP